ncbi:DUF1330 domain-containing protein [Ginsengibacter hankyongi]|uniref:DUF1330 domain-containing protein n=1 Tax=Ginsengibacter hankyongi TaxID=2607284 RepID=A0A5J5ILF3_9BACT|nr:DUF1330 domain-containing protein [Ginsengibacter hankyongi]KAA9040694.1 DUF1330 domain-containing protein [Ginsengibacter hankyongi]
MAAYVIVEIKINDTEKYEEYKKLTPASIAAYDGKFIVRGGATETLEGDWQPGRVVVLEFPDAGSARQWWNSSEYAIAKTIRQSAADTKMILVEGVNFL